MSGPLALAILPDRDAGHAIADRRRRPRLDDPIADKHRKIVSDIAEAFQTTGRYLMKSIKVFSKAILLSGILALGSGTLRAETISQTGSVTVIRGVDDAATADQRQVSRGRSGVTVFRGTSNESAEAPAAPVFLPTTQFNGGENLWIHDAAGNDVTACSLWYDIYGNRTVRCSSSQY
jgi:hypothetical protein